MTREARDLRRNVKVDTDIAVLGDSLGRTTEFLQKGLIRVRKRTGAGLGVPEIIRSFGGSPYPLIPGCEVHIGRDLGGRLAVLGPTFEWMMANGYDPNYLNSGNPRYDWVDLRNAIPARSFASQPPSLSVSIGPLRWIDHDKVVHEFPGANIDLTADIPAADNHGLIVTYILSDETAGYTASTAKALPESVNPVGLADIQECVTAAPDDAIWSGIWHVMNDQGTVTAHDLYDDLRQWINIPGAGTPDLSAAVIKSPDSDTRNTITPTAAANPAIKIIPFSTSHPVPIFEVENTVGGTAFGIRNRVAYSHLLEVGFLGATIVSGAVSGWASRLLVRAQTGTTDDLDTINAEAEIGAGVILLHPDVGDVITVKHGTGNIETIDGSDYDLSGSDIMILLHFDSVWHQVNYLPGQALPASSIASGTLAHERGGLEADVSAYAGFVQISGGTTSQVTEAQLRNIMHDVGDYKESARTTSISNQWLICAGGTIGNGSSGGSVRANADMETLFAHLWDTFADAELPVSSGRGASAAADFAANKTIALPDLRGRAMVMLDNGGGSSANRITAAWADTIGGSGGAETHTLETSEIPAHSHTARRWSAGAETRNTYASTTGQGDPAVNSTAPSTGSTGGDGAHNNIQPSYAGGVVLIYTGN